MKRRTTPPGQTFVQWSAAIAVLGWLGFAFGLAAAIALGGLR